jgi:hypothetical protein
MLLSAPLAFPFGILNHDGLLGNRRYPVVSLGHKETPGVLYLSLTNTSEPG